MKKGDSTAYIKVRGARVHNLKNINVDIPRNKLVVITGLSGSGKSSLAFDTIYAEAERRFVESLSSYARQFLGVREKPDVESLEGLSPGIAINQKSVSKNPRSTVGTITEIYDYLRILFSRAGIPHCPVCKNPVTRQTPDGILRKILEIPQGTAILLLAPVIRDKKGEHKGVLKEIEKGGFLRVRLDGEILRVEEALDKTIDPKKKHSLDVVIDRLLVDAELDRPRLRESVETGLKMARGIIIVNDGERDMLFSENLGCERCGISLPELEPRIFSLNSPHGACTDCTGLGSILEVDSELVFQNKKLTLAEGAIQPWARASHRVGRPVLPDASRGRPASPSQGGQSWYWWMLEDLAGKHHFSLDIPVKNLPKHIIDLILYGDKNVLASDWEGVIPNLKRRWKETDSEWTRAEIEKYMVIETCKSCNGDRLRPEALNVLLNGKSIAEISHMTIEDSLGFFGLYSKKAPKEFSGLLKEIVKRLQFLINVGLGYLALSRSSVTLAGGEAQRVRLATQIGSQLTGVIYVLDEPSIGLHSRDHAMLLATLKHLRDLGNTVLVVEHDRETMEKADWILDLGPGAGDEGGNVVFEGSIAELRKAKTLTGKYISGKSSVILPKRDIKQPSKHLVVRGAREHNLKNIDFKIPLGQFICVSGVSGSGKSTLVNDTLGRALMKHFYKAKEEPAAFKEIRGLPFIDKAVIVDQSPIGRTPRSNPATYTGIFGPVRDLFSKTREAKARGYAPGRFSFNVKGGRCEVCEGQGVKKIEMYFLPDIYVECEECHGKRYNREALEIRYQDFTIADILDLSCKEAHHFFIDTPAISDKLETLVKVGLGYMKLGQSATTLSGGEAQRVKLATELAKKATGKTLYILDEPTTGLHFDDIQKLLLVLAALVEKGNTVLVIEHNLDVLKNADWIIDLGPEGGEAGGYIVAEGTPRDIARNKKSYTGKWLAALL